MSMTIIYRCTIYNRERDDSNGSRVGKFAAKFVPNSNTKISKCQVHIRIYISRTCVRPIYVYTFNIY